MLFWEAFPLAFSQGIPLKFKVWKLKEFLEKTPKEMLLKRLFHPIFTCVADAATDAAADAAAADAAATDAVADTIDAGTDAINAAALRIA